MYRLIHPRFTIVSIALLLASSCGDSSDNNDNNNSPSEQVNDCEPYEPTEASGSESLMWPEQGGDASFTFSVPEDPGGGWVRIEANTANDEISPGVVARLSGSSLDFGTIISGSAAGRDDQQTTTRFFEVAPGRSYDITVSQFGNANADEYPVPFTVDWEYTSVVDCYELNDSPDEAKRIPIGEEIAAYTLTGFRDDDNGFDNRALDDWYQITLDEEAIINVEMTQTPGGNRMSIPIYGPDPDRQVGSGGNTMGETFTSTTTDPVPAGTYFVVVRTADPESRISSFEEPLPVAWDTPYRIIVETE